MKKIEKLAFLTVVYSLLAILGSGVLGFLVLYYNIELIISILALLGSLSIGMIISFTLLRRFLSKKEEYEEH